METGVAQKPVDLEDYKEQLERRLGRAHEVMRSVIHKAQRLPKRVVFPEGEESKVLRAAQILIDEKIAQPILLGQAERIHARIAELHLDLEGARVVEPTCFSRLPFYLDELYLLRHRKGVTRKEAEELLLNRNVFACMMVHLGDADAVVSGLTAHYPDTIRPALQIIKVREGLNRVSGLYLLISPRGDLFFLADTTVNIEPTAEDLAEIALETAEAARRFDVEPRVALLSFSNFGSTPHPLSDKVRRAVELIRRRDPALMVDGEMQADTAVVPEILDETYPFSFLKGPANVLIFPSLESANIAYKLLSRLGGAEAIGPILMGLSKPVHVLQRGAEVADIVNMATIAVVDAQQTLPSHPERVADVFQTPAEEPKKEQAA